MHLYIYIIPQKAEDDIEHLLVVTLRIGIVAIGNGGEKLRRYQVTHQSGANFFIRNVERVNAKFAIAIFYSDIAALIKQRSMLAMRSVGASNSADTASTPPIFDGTTPNLFSISIR